MKTSWLIVLALIVVTAMFANNTAQLGVTNNGSGQSRYEVVAWQEDFESGAAGWTHYDGALSPNNWHVYNAGGTQGNVWWMGDPALAVGANIGGYYDHQYLVLDTPARTLSAANATLTFKMRYNIEGTAGATAPYNGWDALNVRISTNGGTTWTPISGTPAYNMTSSYAFGFEHGEGPNIPGWGGVLNDWTTATFSLSAYVGQSVKIRFAFASDPAYSTGDAPVMFGAMVDDIAFGGYSNNGTDDGQMTWSSLVPLGGDIWHLATDPTAPSPTHIMKCQNAQGSYNPNMMNYLVSPPIQLPSSGDIRVDFMIMGGFTDPNTFPEVDYFGWEISPNNGITWYAMSNPYGSATGMNYVYSDAPSVWSSMTASYSLDGFITDYAGETIILRWYFKSDADTPQGIGIMIDDVKIYNDVFIAAPENLTATVVGSNVTLNWVAPGGGGGGAEGWLNYDGENAGNS
ncbi:MAG: choice-of-anchor J domain-containing protein, partial [Candidatus Cloacimonadaceae bacterium]|nr:choice-of-anchor J domain-containing protein [Candidatus Cloacimonadaceae bacterium]